MVCFEGGRGQYAGLQGLRRVGGGTNGDSEDGSHPVEVVGVGSHRENLRDDRPAGPLDSEDLSQLLEVDGSGLPDGEDVVSEPGHAEVSELVVEELDSELGREERDVLDDGLSNSPLLVLGEVDDGGEEGLGEEVDADDCKKDEETLARRSKKRRARGKEIEADLR